MRNPPQGIPQTFKETMNGNCPAAARPPPTMRLEARVDEAKRTITKRIRKDLILN